MTLISSCVFAVQTEVRQFCAFLGTFAGNRTRVKRYNLGWSESHTRQSSGSFNDLSFANYRKFQTRTGNVR